jgi:xylulokinase
MGSLPSDALFLGFDSSTQSLKATAIDAKLRLYASAAVHFDTDLPHYNTKDGVHRDPQVEGRITGPTLMWVEALDLVLTKLRKVNFPFHKVYAISGSGQQHGSVYWANGAREAYLKTLDPLKGSLVKQLQDAFSIKDSPVWMDSSTSAQCAAIEKALGSAENVAALTGSRAFERFTGPQIKKVYETQESTYHATERISLVSSFMASLLVGDYVAIDHSDGAGMNLMDLHNRTWSSEALDATAPGLLEKLGQLACPHTVAGILHTYFVKRYSFSPTCVVVHWSGDNPCSLAGLALNRPGDLAISMGTSDTVFGLTKTPHPGLEGHVFPNPVDPGSYMAMLCYKNGSLTREDIRNQFAERSWDIFNALLDATPPLNDGKMGFYYKESEILPPLPVGYHRYVLGRDDGNVFNHVGAQKVPRFDNAAEARAIVEGQFLSMRAHAERIGMPCPPERVIATGGGSANKNLLELIASIFGCNVYTAQRPDSAALGGALRAAHGWVCKEEGTFVPMTSVLEQASTDSSFQCNLKAEMGTRELHDRYGQLAAVRVKMEEQLLHEMRSPRNSDSVQ